MSDVFLYTFLVDQRGLCSGSGFGGGCIKCRDGSFNFHCLSRKLDVRSVVVILILNLSRMREVWL